MYSFLQHDDSHQGMFAMFDRMEERNPGMFDAFLEQLTTWGMKRLATQLKKDVQDTTDSQGMFG